MFSTGIDNLAPTAGESGLSPGPEDRSSEFWPIN